MSQRSSWANRLRTNPPASAALLGPVAMHEITQGNCRFVEVIVRDRPSGARDGADIQMVLQVAAHAGQIHCDVNAMTAQMIGRAYAGQHQQLWAVDRASGENDLVRFDTTAVDKLHAAR